ncbi:hypothetical protein CAEBREN_01608 [Caenorhabditis brenneri]|uniref:BTB domain-containing protein n=1 Tax=Caenorhabditis brenneri TaxID=135651 RepID=G0NDR1_CAEBE|nr:hypothetical protein CAEBREN_01608 [Caenorhabditis brenneri]
MDKDITNQPKNFPLGYSSFYVDFPIEKSNLWYNMWFRTIHNIDWKFQVDSTKSDETDKIICTILQQNQPDPLHTIELEACVVVENRDNSDFNVKSQGIYEFSGTDKKEMKLEIPGFEKMLDWKNGYFNDKAEKKTLRFRLMAVVKSVKLCDSVEYFDFYRFDPTIHDVEVNVLGHTLFLSKKLIALQSTYFANLLESQNIAASDLPTNASFDTFFDFLQVLHGVDLSMDSNGLKPFLSLANHLKVPRITEYCKKQMVKGIRGMSTNEIIDVAESWSYWDVVTYITKTLSRVNGSEILNPEFMKTFLNFTTQLATCIGLDNKCDNSRHYKYFSDALTFLGNTVYDSEVFDCLRNISGLINRCIPIPPTLVSNVKKSHNKNFIRCVYRESGTVPTCKIPRVSKKMCSAAQTLRHIIKNYMTFKSDSMEVKVFNPEKLDKCTS